jgi:hypothetical protein
LNKYLTLQATFLACLSKHTRKFDLLINSSISLFPPLAANKWFSASSHEHGYSRFILLSNFNSQYWGYLMKDTCLVDVEVTVLGVVDALP